jgi:uncharacterized protein (TIGR00369 family)
MSDVPEGFTVWRGGGEFMKTNGPLYLYDHGGVVRLGFRVEARHTNPLGICHGGMMASYCDMLLPISAHHKEAALARRFLPTISLQIDYLTACPLGAWVEGEAQVLRATRNLVFMQGLVTTDGTPAARVSGVFKIGADFARVGAPT